MSPKQLELHSKTFMLSVPHVALPAKHSILFSEHHRLFLAARYADPSSRDQATTPSHKRVSAPTPPHTRPYSPPLPSPVSSSIDLSPSARRGSAHTLARLLHDPRSLPLPERTRRHPPRCPGPEHPTSRVRTRSGCQNAPPTTSPSRPSFFSSHPTLLQFPIQRKRLILGEPNTNYFRIKPNGRLHVQICRVRCTMPLAASYHPGWHASETVGFIIHR
jgi:hypothetical protein